MRKKKVAKENGERWLLTYSDMITLLMIFFIIMYASSSTDTIKYKAVSQSFKVAFGGGKSVIGNDAGVDIKTNTAYIDTKSAQAELQSAEKIEQNKLNQVKQKVDQYLKDNNMSNTVTTKIDERGLVISLQDTVLFDTGKADIKPEATSRLIAIGTILNTVDNYIHIEGHADSVPISTYLFESNWDLASKRSNHVIGLFMRQTGIRPERCTATSYAEFRPIADNTTEIGRAKNRRVDIIVVNSKFNVLENKKN